MPHALHVIARLCMVEMPLAFSGFFVRTSWVHQFCLPRVMD